MALMITMIMLSLSTNSTFAENDGIFKSIKDATLTEGFKNTLQKSYESDSFDISNAKGFEVRKKTMEILENAATIFADKKKSIELMYAPIEINGMGYTCNAAFTTEEGSNFYFTMEVSRDENTITKILRIQSEKGRMVEMKTETTPRSLYSEMSSTERDDTIKVEIKTEEENKLSFSLVGEERNMGIEEVKFFIKKLIIERFKERSIF